MAIIQKIRNRAGLLVAVIIGMALIAFILGDLLSSGNQMLKKANNNVAVVNGKGISIEIFQKIITEQEELTKMQSGTNTLDEQLSQDIKQRAWNDMIQGLVLDREVNKIGLTVCSDEMYDMVSGNNPHPFIMQFFADPNTGVINRMALNQFLLQINDLDETNQQKMFWFYLEDLIYRERKTMKYNTLLRQGLYSTNLEADKRKNELNTSVNFSYCVKRYNEVADSLIDVTDADIKNYYKEHKNEFKQEKSRDIRYVVWEVVPSEKDVAYAEAWINDIKGDFESITPENSAQYAKANSDIIPDSKNYAKGELETNLDAFAFEASEGDVYGPYFEENIFKLSKLSKIDYLPDSVKASHILLSANQNSDFAAIQKLADSLKTMVEDGANINTLALQYSDDQIVQQTSGDLGWFTEGKNGKPFSDSCFYGKTGDVKLVLSQSGLHILKIEAQSRPTKKVKISTIAREVRASSETDQLFFTQASEFGATHNTKEKFNLAIEEGKVTAITQQNLLVSDNGITGLSFSRPLIKWVYNNKEGNVTPRVMEFENKYVVAIIDKVREDDFASIEDVKASISVEVRKQKQAEKLVATVNEALEGDTDILSVANKLNTTSNSANNVKFTSFSIPNLGVEPKIQAIAVNLEQDEMSAPIKGNNGVYVIQLINKELSGSNDNNSAEKMFLNRSYATRVNYSSMEILNELAEVEDNRINFF